MTTSKTFVADKEISITYATAITSGYGHKKITVEIEYDGNYKIFSDVTSHMPGYDKAVDLEGEDRDMALYNLIERSIIDQIAEWIEELDSDNE